MANKHFSNVMSSYIYIFISKITKLDNRSYYLVKSRIPMKPCCEHNLQNHGFSIGKTAILDMHFNLNM